MRFKGKALKYGDHIDTDVIIAGHRLVHGSNIELMAQYAMESIDKDFHKKIKDGASILIAGKNFGCGSSRQQAPEVLKQSGVKVIVADSFARIFYRNAINIGLPALIAEGVSSIISEGDTVEVDLETGSIKNLTNGKSLKAKPIPPFLVEILNDGGLINHLKKKIESGEV
ncbi:MAG: 3-isopropylmalate dehydratase small subunit [Candidatus Odinarchaeia archaeon]